jgi:hypothetical protein
MNHICSAVTLIREQAILVCMPHKYVLTDSTYHIVVNVHWQKIQSVAKNCYYMVTAPL